MRHPKSLPPTEMGASARYHPVYPAMHEINATGRRTRCRKLPSFIDTAMDVNPWTAPALSGNLATSDRLRLVLMNRTIDMPFGYNPETAKLPVPLLGGVFVKPLNDTTKHADFQRFSRVLNLAESDAAIKLTVLVLGGSMTAGRMEGWANINQSKCFQNLPEFDTDNRTQICYTTNHHPRWKFNPTHVDCKPCAFAARLEYWLRKSYPRLKVNVINQARGGEGTTTCIGRIGGTLNAINASRDIDVVILNFVDNDVAKVGQFASEGRSIHTKMKLNGDVSAAEKKLQAHAESKLRADHEILIRELLQLPKRPALLSMQLYGQALVYPPHKDVLEYYRIPSISWKLSAGFLKVPPAIDRHPSWPWHQLVADWIAFTWTHLARHACIANPGLEASPHPDILEILSPRWANEDDSAVCVNPVTYLDAGNQTAAGRPVVMPEEEVGPWRLSEDREGNGKMAWWADSPDGGSITFPIHTARFPPKIGVSFLASWDPAMGSARFSIVGDPAGWFMVINASRPAVGTDRISVSEYARLCVPSSALTREQTWDQFHNQGAVLRRCEGTQLDPAIIKGIVETKGPVKRALRVELLPSLGKPRNKFAIRYITAC